MNTEDKKTKKLIEEIIQKRVCASRADARRLILMLPEEKIREKLDRVKVIKVQPETMS